MEFNVDFMATEKEEQHLIYGSLENPCLWDFVY